MKKQVLTLAMAGALSSVLVGTASAKDLSVVRRLDGYECVGVNIPNEVPHGPPVQLPQLHAEPSDTSPQVALGQSSMIAWSPLKRSNGFVQVITLTKIQGWIRASLITPWHSAAFPTMRCHPALMSNGLLGFDYDKPGG